MNIQCKIAKQIEKSNTLGVYHAVYENWLCFAQEYGTVNKNVCLYGVDAYRSTSLSLFHWIFIQYITLCDKDFLIYMLHAAAKSSSYTICALSHHKSNSVCAWAYFSWCMHKLSIFLILIFRLCFENDSNSNAKTNKIESNCIRRLSV